MIFRSVTELLLSMSNTKQNPLINCSLPMLLSIAVLAAIIIANFISNSFTLADRIALGGWSPIDWVNHLAYPENFMRDFPSGLDYSRSLSMYIYPLLYFVFNINPETTIYFYLFFEITILAAAVWYLTRTILPDSNPEIAALAVILIVSSSIGMADISRIAIKPYYAGLYYNVAEAFRLFAIAMALRGRWWTSSILISLALTTHPIIGSIGACVIAIIFMLQPDVYKRARPWAAMIFSIIVTSVWFYYQIFSGTTINENQIPFDIWVDFTTALSSHWYTYDYGMLTDFHGQHFLPLLGLLMLYFTYLHQVINDVKLRKILFYSGLGLVILVVLGIIFSTWPINAFLIKLNLQRASQLLIWLGLPVIITGLFKDLFNGNVVIKLAACSIIFSPFISDAILPIISVLVVTIPRIVVYIKSQSSFDYYRLSVIGIYALILCLLIWYVAFSGYFINNKVYYHGSSRAWVMSLFFVTIIYTFNKLNFNYRNATLLLLFVAFLSANWIIARHDQLSANHEKAVAFRDVQLWARNNTRPNALFFVDPLILYGWRDYSRRSSFGNIREWLHTSWLYDSDYANYKEGLKRFNELGIDPYDYILERPTNVKMSRLYSDVHAEFYKKSDQWRKAIAEKYDISYFVMQKSKIKTTNMNTVYENNWFVVLDADSEDRQ